MIYYNIFMTVLAVFFCSWATYTDMRHGKIRNICSIGLIYAGLIRLLILFFIGDSSLRTVLSTFILGGLISFGAYWIGILAAGDAKLYCGVTLMLPSSVWGRNQSAIPYPALIILINMFFAYFIYSLIYTLVRHLRSRKVSIMPNFWRVKGFIEGIPRNMLLFLRFMSVLLWVQYLANILNIQLGFYQLLLSLALYYAMEYALRRLNISRYTSHFIYYVPSIIILTLNPAILQVYWKMFLLWAVVYQIVLPIVVSYGLKMDGSYLSNSVQIQDLKRGMIPGERIIKIQTGDEIEYIKEPAVSSKLYDKDALVSPDPAGLSEEQIQELKSLSELGYFEKVDNSLMVQHPMHFALTILSGILITIACGGPFYMLIYR
ncbi:hypothetical protein FJZ33_01090 [Candidatus Poribacteria bacterium]|nr:hypothetical protein [Candidatus Poribacteria bacterium]